KMRSATLPPAKIAMVPGRTVAIRGACRGMTPKSPSVPGTTTISTGLASSSRSGETSSNSIVSAIGSGRLGRHAAGLLDRLVDRADHVEGRFRQVVVVAGDDALEALDGVFQADQLAGRAREDLGDEEGLGHEALDLAGA